MRFHYAGTYSGNEADLPQRNPMPEGTVAFREPESTTKLALIASVISIVLLALLWELGWWRAGRPVYSLLGIVLSLVAAVPHEFIHAVWFREDVYMFTNLKQGMLFVVGPEDMSRSRFIAMSLAPAVVLGVIPFVAWLIHPAPELDWLASFGIFSFVYASADFINVFNALTQMPVGAKTFLSGMHSFWYQP